MTAVKHRLLEKDPEARTGTCERCGPVRLHASGRGGWVCAVKNRTTGEKWRAENPDRAREKNAQWRRDNPERVAQQGREWRAANPDKVAAIELRRRLNAYSLTVEAYEALLDSQSGVCATCYRTESGGQGRWHIDHDHACCPAGRSCGNCVRGLLCSSCNRALGLVRDDPNVLRRMADYLSN